MGFSVNYSHPKGGAAMAMNRIILSLSAGIHCGCTLTDMIFLFSRGGTQARRGYKRLSLADELQFKGAGLLLAALSIMAAL